MHPSISCTFICAIYWLWYVILIIVISVVVIYILVTSLGVQDRGISVRLLESSVYCNTYRDEPLFASNTCGRCVFSQSCLTLHDFTE